MADNAVPVVLPDGTAGTAPAASAQKIVEQGGRALSAAEATQAKKAAELSAKYDFSEHPVDAYLGQTAANMAALYRGLTFGQSDVAAAKLGGEEARQKLLELQEAHPIGSAAMEMAGQVGSLAAGGEVLGGVKGLQALKATTGAGRLVQGAARAGAEMGLYGAGKEASRQALAGEDLNAQKIVASGAHEAVWGALLGGGLSALGEGLGAARAARGATRTEATAAAPIAESAEAAAAREAKPGSLRETLGAKAQEAADDQFANALGATKGQIKTINRTVDGGWSRVAADTKTALREEMGVSSLPADRRELQESLERAIDKRSAARTEMLAKLDDAKSGIAPSPENVVAKLRDELVSPNLVRRTVETADGPAVQLVPRFGKEATVKEANALIERLESGFGDSAPTFKEWAKAITDIGKEGKWEAKTTPISAEVKQQAYGILSSELDAAGDAASATMGTSFSAEYRANQKVIQSLLKARELVETGVAGVASNNKLGLRSSIAGIVGSGVGAMVGGPVGTLVGGAAAAGVGKVIQDRGAMLASDLLDRAAGVLGVRSVAARTEAAVSRGIGELVGKASNDNALGQVGLKPPTVKTPRPEGLPREQYAKIASQLRRVAANPERASGIIEQRMGEMTNVSPTLTSAVVATILRGTDYLQKQLPKEHVDFTSLQPQLQKPRVSDADVSKFMRAHDTVVNPLSVLDDARKGTLMRDQVDALKAVYPDLYDDLRAQVMERLTESDKELPYSKRIQLGILLDIPSDKTLSPDFKKAIEATYPSGAEAGAESPPPQNAPRLQLSEPTMTATEAAAHRL